MSGDDYTVNGMKMFFASLAVIFFNRKDAKKRKGTQRTDRVRLLMIPGFHRSNRPQCQHHNRRNLSADNRRRQQRKKTIQRIRPKPTR